MNFQKSFQIDSFNISRDIDFDTKPMLRTYSERDDIIIITNTELMKTPVVKNNVNAVTPIFGNILNNIITQIQNSIKEEINIRSNITILNNERREEYAFYDRGDFRFRNVSFEDYMDDSIYANQDYDGTKRIEIEDEETDEFN